MNSDVPRNVVTGAAGILLQGGGLYIQHPLTLTNTVIAQSTPVQCLGC